MGLDELTFGELKSSDRLREVLESKLQLLDDQKFPDQLLARRVNLFIDILRETLLDNYQALSIRAFAHLVVAVDYFLVVKEEGGIPDTYVNGYSDDLKVVEQAYLRFEKEIKAFQAWRARQPKEGVWDI